MTVEDICSEDSDGLSHPTTLDVTKVLSALGPDRLVARPGLSPAHISSANPHGFVPAQRKPNWPNTHRTSLTVASSLYAPQRCRRKNFLLGHPSWDYSHSSTLNYQVLSTPITT
ncbi:hypothetical protein ACLOJK_010934 [Asimina triloba]